MIEDTLRIHGHRSGSPQDKRYVLYWMQQSQRTRYNHALDHSIKLAGYLGLPVMVVFCVSDQVPHANARHYRFMVEGLAETGHQLALMSIPFIVSHGQAFMDMVAQCAHLVTDTGYLRWQRKWRAFVYEAFPQLPYTEVESDVIVPVKLVSPKEEYAAATIRRKILRRLPEFLVSPETTSYIPRHHLRLMTSESGCTNQDSNFGTDALWEYVQSVCALDHSVDTIDAFKGGYSEAVKRLERFLANRLRLYKEQRNDPGNEIQSDLSPYLHFGQISALDVSMRCLKHLRATPEAIPELILSKSELSGMDANLASFLEEMIIRRELSCNFCHYNQDYDTYQAVPLWARQTLHNHLSDPRPRQYLLDSLESATTDDVYWNSAQKEMVLTGKMHNYMRMYWGKKIIEWTPDPETAHSTMMYLNDKYELDGRDPNSYAGIAWCFGKHDRPWQERGVFGTVRYMNFAGLKRKFDMQSYLARIEKLERG